VREDVGRHNAVDKVFGWALLEGRLPLSQVCLFVSGRIAFEIVQKAVRAGVPVVAAVSAATSLAAKLAIDRNVTLVGFLRGDSCTVYAGRERIRMGADASAPGAS
jgi:FdhD protein